MTIAAAGKTIPTHQLHQQATTVDFLIMHSLGTDPSLMQ